jgi:hypothetical protein
MLSRRRSASKLTMMRPAELKRFVALGRNIFFGSPLAMRAASKLRRFTAFS